MHGEESPLDFIKNNTKPNLPPQQPDINPQSVANQTAVSRKEKELAEAQQAIKQTPAEPQRVSAQPEPKKTAQSADAVQYAQPDSGATVQNPVAPEEQKFDPLGLLKESLRKPGDIESPPLDNVVTEDLDAPETELGADGKPASIETNYKNLRTTYKETKKALREKEELLTKTTEELTKYKSGEVLPDALKEKESRIANLEKYEQIVSLKTSPEYQRKVIEPLSSLTKKLDVIAADYKIPPEVLRQATEFTSQAQLNNFLSDNFDAVGAIEVKQLINQAKEIEQTAKQMESEPSAALTNLITEGQRAEQARKVQERAQMQVESRNAWADSLNVVKQEGRILELIPKEGDEEYNSKYIYPILEKASEEYGKLVVALAENGLSKLPKELAHALSRLTQLAHASALSIESRNHSLQKAQDIEKNTTRNTRYIRPQIGSSVGRGGEPAAPAPSSPRSAADVLLGQIGIK